MRVWAAMLLLLVCAAAAVRVLLLCLALLCCPLVTVWQLGQVLLVTGLDLIVGLKVVILCWC